MEKCKTNRKPIVGESFAGTLFVPEGKGPHPGVVVVPGSDSGIPEAMAQHIAAEGYAVFALGYFRAEGLPQYLEYIPLEYFKHAIEWFKKQPQVKNEEAVLLGYSRGGELALLIGSIFPNLLKGLIAYVPSSVVWGGFPFPNRPAWLLDHKPVIPFMKGLMSLKDSFSEAEDLLQAVEKGIIPYHANTSKDPYHIVDLFLARQINQIALEESAIPVEKIACPLLILAGEDDKIWPSAFYAKQIMDRLERKGSSISKKFIIYPEAGHGVVTYFDGAIYHPVGKFWCCLGGTTEGNQQASESAWKETFAFLKEISS